MDDVIGTVIVNLLMYVDKDNQRGAWENLQKEVQLSKETIESIEKHYFYD